MPPHVKNIPLIPHCPLQTLFRQIPLLTWAEQTSIFRSASSRGIRNLESTPHFLTSYTPWSCKPSHIQIRSKAWVVSTNEAAADRPVCPCEREHGLAFAQTQAQRRWMRGGGCTGGAERLPANACGCRSLAALSPALGFSLRSLVKWLFVRREKRFESHRDKNINFISDCFTWEKRGTTSQWKCTRLFYTSVQLCIELESHMEACRQTPGGYFSFAYKPSLTLVTERKTKLPLCTFE